MEDSSSTVIAFTECRRRTWRAIRPWVLVFLLGFVLDEAVFFIEREHVETTTKSGPLSWSVKQSISAQDMSPQTFTLGLISIVLMGAAIIAVTTYVRRYYRCPRCNSVPMGWGPPTGPSQVGASYGVEIYPSRCPKCRAQLR